MKHLILGAISAFICLSNEGAWAAETLPEFKDTTAKSSSHPALWRFRDLNLRTDAGNGHGHETPFGEPGSEGMHPKKTCQSLYFQCLPPNITHTGPDRNLANFYSMDIASTSAHRERNLKTETTSESYPSHQEDPETNALTAFKSRMVQRRPVPPAVVASAAKTLMKSPQPQRESSVQLNPDKATYTWKGDHYEKIQPYGL
jgi:hypothetical protein